YLEQGWNQAGSDARLRLWPEAAHARERYWKPGTYRLRAVVEVERNPLSPKSWYGRLVSNPLTVTVAAADAPVPAPLQDAKLRKQAAAWVADLEAKAVAKRDAAARALKEAGPWVLPLLEDAMPKAAPDAARRIEDIQKDILRLHIEGKPRS